MALDSEATALKLTAAENAAIKARFVLRSAAISVTASNLRSRPIEALRRRVVAYLDACEAGTPTASLEKAVCDAAAKLPLRPARVHVLQGLARALQDYRSARAAVTRARARHAAAVRRAAG
jgi:hypothetical protein